MNGLKEELAQLEEKSLRRHLRVVEQMDGARLVIEGRSLLNFSSNNYLGLSRHPQVVEAVKEVLNHWGAGATSSRLISGTSIIHQDLESALAAFVGKEAALLFPTGYQANLGVVTSLVRPGDAVVMDRLCHASLVDAVRLSGARLFVYTHADVQDAERVLKRTASYRRRLLITESLFSMNGDFAPLPELLELAQTYNAISLVDEAHALGVWGNRGRGLTTGQSENRLVGETEKAADIVVGTLSKSFGSQGGFIAGSKELVEIVINNARSFIFTTGLSPLNVAASHAALGVSQENEKLRLRVKELAKQLRMGLHGIGLDILQSESQIVPILLKDAKTALSCSAYLWKEGICAPAIRPPTVHIGECRLRFSITADQNSADIETLLNCLRAWKDGLLVDSPVDKQFVSGNKINE